MLYVKKKIDTLNVFDILSLTTLYDECFNYHMVKLLSLGDHFI